IALRAAAERATALHAHAVAFRHLHDALDITSDPAEQVALNLACAESADAIANPESFAYALRAAAVAKDLGDREAVIRATTMAGKQLTNRGSGTEALVVLEPLVAGLSEDEPGA
ncbi:MAG: hypothetical protein WEI16_04985, partial [Chloroflexota bacterium]